MLKFIDFMPFSSVFAFARPIIFGEKSVAIISTLFDVLFASLLITIARSPVPVARSSTLWVPFPIIASLAAGNTVVFKPSSDAVPTAWVLYECFRRAGISGNTLQFVPCSGNGPGERLVSHPDVDYAVLTGGTQTALRILARRPDLALSAETGGKNSTIVTAMADRDQAIKNIVHSAFSNGGQKCSATSLLILEREVYEDAAFRRQLTDATQSLSVGSAWEFQNRVGPLIHPPAGDLLRGLTTLEPGEFWALRPRNLDGNPHLWTPGIKWGVRRGSFTHQTELFGPVLAVMCSENLDEAVDIANDTGYGLTAGLESLDLREQERWKRRIVAGNLYVNRGTTGAVTLRQPFGGMKRSSVGAGFKAGGPDYAAQFMAWEETGPPQTGFTTGDHPLHRVMEAWEFELRAGRLAEHACELEKTLRAVRSYRYVFEREFAQGMDYFHLRGQDNILRYLPVGSVAVRVHEEDGLFETLARIAAAQITGCRPELSLPRALGNAVARFLTGPDGAGIMSGVECVRETDLEFAARLGTMNRARYAHPGRVPAIVWEKAAENGFYIARNPVMMEGRLELPLYLLQQSVCDNHHRYGNLGERDHRRA